LVQYWKAIFRACSTAEAPSEAKRKWGEVHGDHGGQGLGQLHHHPVAVAEEGGMGHEVELATQGGVELGDRWPRVVTQSEEMASR
jgi:hypothetical protein